MSNRSQNTRRSKVALCARIWPVWLATRSGKGSPGRHVCTGSSSKAYDMHSSEVLPSSM